MFTVSLIGPDGVGKTTIARRLEDTLPMPVKYIYIGLNAAAANISLPTTSLRSAILNRKLLKDSPSHFRTKSEAHNSPKPKHTAIPSQVFKFVRKTLGVSNRILEEWYRQCIAYLYEKKGYIIIYDRHFIYDFYDFNGCDNNGQKTVARKTHDFIRNKTMSPPDLVIFLDAPGEVVFKRKGEFNVEDLETKRRQYLSLRKVVKNFVIIDANRSLDVVIKDVGNHIKQFHQSIL